MDKGYRLVWFHHFSKAAGSSIVHLAGINGEHFYPGHLNGNPCGEDGNVIQFWNMGEQELYSFVDRCEGLGVSFVTSEWGAPDFSLLARDPRVVLVTCLRDPLQRFVSNFYYAFYTGRTDCRSPLAYLDSSREIWGTYTRSNYYCRMFSGLNHHGDAVDEPHFKQAKDNLAKFDVCAILKGAQPFKGLCERLAWRVSQTHVNRTSSSLPDFLRMLLKGQLGLIWRRISNPRRNPDAEFVRHFQELNQWDYRLMDEFLP